MKILNIIPNNGLGGAEQSFINYNKALSNKGHKVFAIYNRYGKIKNKIKEMENVKYIADFFFRPFFLLLPYYFGKVLALNPDIIICHNTKILGIFNIIGFILRIPIILVANNQKTKYIHRADYIFSITEFQKNIFKENGFKENNIFVIPNMVSFTKEYKEPQYLNPPVLGVIGRFDPMKGFSLFITACNILKNKGIKFKAKIAGSPQMEYIAEYKKIKRLVRNYNLQNEIEFTGWINNREIFYEDIDIFILPSTYEPFGIVLLEAMMYGKPIIASKTEGPSEILKDEKDALMFENKNTEEMAKIIEKLINNLNLAKQISKSGYELVNSKYTLDIVASQIEQALNEIFKK